MMAARAAGPGFLIEIPALLDDVARVKMERRASLASMYCCHVSNPREHKSIARARCGEALSLRYMAIDFEMSHSVLAHSQRRGLTENDSTHVVVRRLYLSIAIFAHTLKERAAVSDCLSSSGRRYGTGSSSI